MVFFSLDQNKIEKSYFFIRNWIVITDYPLTYCLDNKAMKYWQWWFLNGIDILWTNKECRCYQTTQWPRNETLSIYLNIKKTTLFWSDHSETAVWLKRLGLKRFVYFSKSLLSILNAWFVFLWIKIIFKQKSPCMRKQINKLNL